MPWTEPATGMRSRCFVDIDLRGAGGAAGGPLASIVRTCSENRASSVVDAVPKRFRWRRLPARDPQTVGTPRMTLHPG